MSTPVPDPRHLAETAVTDGLTDNGLWDEVLADHEAVTFAIAELNGSLQSVNAQLANANDTHEDDVDFQWLRKARNYRALVERRLLQAKAVDKVNMQRRETAAREVRAKEVNRLLDAIYRHRRATLDAEITPEDHDVALWEVREAITRERSERKRADTAA